MEMVIFIIAQVLGIVSAIPVLIAGQLKKMSHVLINSLLGDLIVGISYLLLGNTSAFLLCATGCVKTVISMQYLKQNRLLPLSVFCFFTGINVVSTVLSWKGWLSALSFVAGFCGSLAGRQFNPKYYRMFMLANTSLWFVNDVFSLAYSQAIVHAVLFVSMIIGTIRNKDFSKKPTPKNT